MTGEDATILGQLQKKVRAVPDRLAASDAWESVTYRELWTRARSFASLLREREREREREGEDGLPVGICLSASVNRVAAMLGVMLAGSPYVPIDMNFPTSRITSIVSTSGTFEKPRHSAANFTREERASAIGRR